MEHTTPGFPALAAGNAIRQSFISDKELLGSDSRFLQGTFHFTQRGIGASLLMPR